MNAIRWWSSHRPTEGAQEGTQAVSGTASDERESWLTRIGALTSPREAEAPAPRATRVQIAPQIAVEPPSVWKEPRELALADEQSQPTTATATKAAIAVNDGHNVDGAVKRLGDWIAAATGGSKPTVVPPAQPEESPVEKDLELEERIAQIFGRAVEQLGDLYRDDQALDVPHRVRDQLSEWYHDEQPTEQQRDGGRWRHSGGIWRLLYTGAIGWVSWRLTIPHHVNHLIWDFAEQGEGIGGGMVIGGAIVLVSSLPAVWCIRLGRSYDNSLGEILRHRVTLFAPLVGGIGSVPLLGSILGLALYTPGLGVHL
ncbi:hypothetical protein ABR737_00975 [Streptomyces sp. Edi2]|uniref:hypothetical protein n=1 Tax=Streptomyces sp. Edi2 TaxID=3162528 RepID=UPI003305F9FC